MTTHKLTISATGACRNAKIDLRELVRQATDGAEDPDIETFSIETCIEGFYDTLLALAKGMITVEEMQAFWFKNEKVSDLGFIGKVVTFGEDEK